MYFFLNKLPGNIIHGQVTLCFLASISLKIFLPTLKCVLPTYHSHTQTSARLHRIVYNNQAISQL